MFEEKICPYPGLRPFNDDESIFFKGRDRNITSIVSQFEKKKFMMLTGASGDGKSSLVYAGIVPNARAGLFKARYNNWAVADFRPERSPLHNLSTALNRYFGFASIAELEQQLSYGFTSLVNIYKSSPMYLDTEGANWKETDETGQKRLRKQASNLLIIADQFEEFFTNTENYHNGVASVESQTVVHLLLETARIALAEDLPIYIICTMRSDYIGQCAAFRGLPEYIGSSQFFVPRLKRNEIAQVIEEPALLNGDRISRRLVERLLNDITEGYDQLPILQHALNQIWKMAGNGTEEMDLLHYAMVAGFPARQLPNDDRDKFNAWFDTLPEYKKRLYDHPSLENILNAHADELLETAYERYAATQTGRTTIGREDTKQIIRTAFQCLTKIDEARAVRNRMTLQEITDIIHRPEITTEVVGSVLDVFREQGNTFIKPFITAESSTQQLQRDTVLDITHESLIRNWSILDTWAQKEYHNLNTWQDFHKQLDRWVRSGKRKGFLLPIGPLTFFENWYNTCNPNKYWLARYDERETDAASKVKDAEALLEDATQFIRRSANALFVSRTVMKYGADRLLAYFGIFVLISSCAYFYNDYKSKQNEVVLEEVIERGKNLLSSEKVDKKTKAAFLINMERLRPGSYRQNLKDHIITDTTTFDLLRAMMTSIEWTDENITDTINPLAFSLLEEMTDCMDRIILTELKKGRRISVKNQKRLDNYINHCQEWIRKSQLPGARMKIIYNHSYDLAHLVISNELTRSNDSLQALADETIDLINDCFESRNHDKELIELIHRISPFESAGVERFNRIFPSEKKSVAYISKGLSHNGGYLLLAFAYACTGEESKMLQCIDSLFIEKQLAVLSKEGILPKYFAGFFLKHHSFPKLCDPFYKKWSKCIGASTESIVEKTIYSFNGNYGNLNEEYTNLNQQKEVLWDYYVKLIESSSCELNEKNFKLALSYKSRGIFLSQFTTSQAEANASFLKAIEYYRLIPASYLSKDTVITTNYDENSNLKKSSLFLYPGWAPDESPWFISNSNLLLKNAFAGFFVKNGLTDLFNSKEDCILLEKYLYKCESTMYFNDDLPDKYQMQLIFDFTERLCENNKIARDVINQDFLVLHKINAMFAKRDTASAMGLLRSLTINRFYKVDFLKDEYEHIHIVHLKQLARNLACNHYHAEAMRCIQALLKPAQRRNVLIEITDVLQQLGQHEKAFVYLDDLFTEIGNGNKFGNALFLVLGKAGGNPMHHIAFNLIKEIDDKSKPVAFTNLITGLSIQGLYYQAKESIPLYTSSTTELMYINQIIYSELMKVKVGEPGWRNYDFQKLPKYYTNWMYTDIEYEGEGTITFGQTTGE